MGRSHGSAYSHRKRSPEFSKAWDEAVAAQQREWLAAHQERLAARRGKGLDGAGGGRLTPWRDRSGGWDARKRGLFLRTLARTKRVDLACKAAGMSASAAYYLRGQSSRFAGAWEKALAGAPPPSVAEAAYERAVNGWDEPIIQGGQVVGHKRRYSDSLLRDLLRAERERDSGGRSGKGWRPMPRTLDEVRDSILGKLERIEQHRCEQEEEEQREAWERWQRCWRG